MNAPQSSRPLVNNPKLKQFFAGVSSRMELAQTNLASSSSPPLVVQPELENFFFAVSHQVELAETQQRRLDKQRATGFNVFDLIDPDENKLSDVLKGLLDPRGDHGQGDLFLRLLFKQLGLGACAKLAKNATVQREAPTHGILKYRRRMDVFVEAGALVAIENKVNSLEQAEQAKDYMEHLRYCTKRNGKDSVLIYLSPDGKRPESLNASETKTYEASGKLHCWSYQRNLRPWLESCRRECEACRICDFISDFIAYIESSFRYDSENTQAKEIDEN